MSVPPPVPAGTGQGRGAWSRTGGATPYYEYVASAPVGAYVVENPTIDPKAHDARAVNFGVQAIQRRINAMGLSPALQVDGWFGAVTKSAAIWAQDKLGLGPGDGVIGPRTCQALFTPVLDRAAAEHAIPAMYLHGLVRTESLFDPGAVGYTTPDDHGLVQINAFFNQTVTLAQAFDPGYGANYAAARLASAYAKYGRWDCAIASYNNPSWADQWYASGKPPNDQIAQYVAHVELG